MQGLVKLFGLSDSHSFCDKPDNGFCTVCGKAYHKNKPFQKYCSDDCRSKAFEVVCQYCGVTFRTGNRRKTCCSEACVSNAHSISARMSVYGSQKNLPEVLVCKVCGSKYNKAKSAQKNKARSSFCRKVLRRVSKDGAK